MTTVSLSKLDSNGNAIITYTIDNLDVCTMDYSMPTSLLAMPNNNDSQAVAIKVDGNTSIVSMSWIIRDVSGGSSTVSGSDPSVVGSNVKTILQQLNFFDTHFQTVQLTDIFKITINDSSTPYSKTGNLIQMSFSVTSSAPITIQANITLQTGNVIIAYGGDVPQAPTGVVATAIGSGQVSLAWTDASDHGSQAITSHNVQYYTAGVQYIAVNTGSSSTSYTVSGLVVGQAYAFQINTQTSKGAGTWSNFSSWVTVT
jgi:hypothetical protein